jgi:hypothetical protein
LEELKAPVIRGRLGRLGERVELASDADLALQGSLNRRLRRGVLGRPRPYGRQIERDFVVDEEADDLRRVLGFLDGLAVEEASPLLEALPLEVQGDPVVRLVSAELVANLLDEQVADPVTDHGCPSSIELLRTEDTLDGRSLGRRGGGDRRGRLRSPNQGLRCSAPLATGPTRPHTMNPLCVAAGFVYGRA